MRQPRRHSTMTIAAFVLGAGVAAAPSPASASTAPGAEYNVSFTGTFSEDVTQTTSDGSTTFTQTQTGSWTVESRDPAFLLWFPKAKVPDHALGGVDVNGGTDGAYLDPASLTDNGHDSDGNSWSCTTSLIGDTGQSPMSADVVNGEILVVTSFEGFSDAPGDRVFHTAGGGASSCTNGAPLEVNYPPEPGTNENNNVAYGVTVPFSSIGKASFEEQAVDLSRINQASYWARNGYGAPNFQVTGTYKFTKKCDGTVTFGDGYTTGKCASGKPNTKVTKNSIDKKKRRIKITFTGTGGSPPISFQCKRDKGSFKKCKSPATFGHLKKGGHTITVRAKDAAGNVDKSPATVHFTI